jgi:hypothetical protein
MMFYQYSAIRRQIFKKWETNTFIEFFLDILQTGKKIFPPDGYRNVVLTILFDYCYIPHLYPWHYDCAY